MEIIAYYLPQYYPFEENNRWWGEGFTEWTNVGKAKPLFHGHDQPKLPADLGYYDLRLKEVQKKQIALAKEAAVTAFCYWHYWFGDGRVLLDQPLKALLDDPSLDFPLCLAWANESWMAKVWNSDNTTNKCSKVLIEQHYPGESDIVRHFEYIRRFIEDPRYLRIDGKPVFVIYKPLEMPDISDFMRIWNTLIKKYNIADSFYFIGHLINANELPLYQHLNFSAINIVRIAEHKYQRKVRKTFTFQFAKYRSRWLRTPLILPYSFISRFFVQDEELQEKIFPTIIPNWDHTPRSKRNGTVFHESTPELFEHHIKDVMKALSHKPANSQVAFLKSWNEWGEGNYMEPDLRFGKRYIKVLGKLVRDRFTSSHT